VRTDTRVQATHAEVNGSPHRRKTLGGLQSDRKKKTSSGKIT